MKKKQYTCVCCGHKVFEELFGYEICPVCGWEDDPTQIRFPLSKGANKISLVEAQINFIKTGVLYKGFLNFSPSEKYEKDSEWRTFLKSDLVDEKDDGVNEIDYPIDMTKLYYWNKKYWKK